MLSPIMPHVAEEFWHELGRSTFVVKEQWPLFDESMINADEEAIEELIDSTMSDIRKGIELTSKITANSGKKVREIRVIIADDWKTEAYNALAKEKNMGKVMAMPSLRRRRQGEALQVPLPVRQEGQRARRGAEPEVARTIVKGFTDSSKYLSERLGAQVSAIPESESKSDRASRALPGKPAIDIVWE